MFEFSHIWFLLLLLPAAEIFIWAIRRRKPALRYPDFKLFAGLPMGRSAWVGFFRAALRGIALLAAIIALAGPRLPDQKTRLPTEGIAIMLVLDNSGSMADEFEWSGSEKIARRDAAKKAFHLFVEGGEGPGGIKLEGRSTERGSDAIGLVIFSTWPQPVCPPTLNHKVLLRILDETRPPDALDSATNIGDAIAEGLIRLQKTPAPRKVLILLTDGEHNYDLADPDRKPLTPRQAAQLAANLKIPIYVIDTGGNPESVKESEREQRAAGRRINQEIAAMTGGRSFAADDGAELLAVCKEIDTLERQPILSHSYRRYHELYPWFIAAALGCWLWALFLDATFWRQLP